MVHAVLSTFLQRLPEGERRHVAAHLPPDVPRLAMTRHRVGRSGRPARTPAELTAQVMTADGMSAEQAGRVIAAVLGALRVLVPEEAADVASVLPAELRVLWETAPGGNLRPPDDPRERGGRSRPEEVAMATAALDEGARLARAVVRQLGGRFSVELGIDVDAGDAEIDRWFVAATLFGTRISTTVAERAFRVLDENGITRIAHASERTWSELVELLDAAGYVRYDYRTATRLQDLAAAVRDRWGAAAEIGRRVTDPRDLAAALDDLPGWGPVTVGLFLRELRGVWPGACLPLDPRAAEAARHLGLLGASTPDDLGHVGEIATRAAVDARDLEAALVRLALRHRRPAACPGGHACTAVVHVARPSD